MNIPVSVLSGRLSELLANKRVTGAVFTSFQLDIGFFESEILPTLFNIPLSQGRVRLAQLEMVLSQMPQRVAVYYDASGLVSPENAPRLDIGRYAIYPKPGTIFHPKNVFLLAEDNEPDDGGQRCQYLLMGAMSANLTRSGWWENIECAHFELISEHDRSSLGNCYDFLRAMTRMAADNEHPTVEAVCRFLRGRSDYANVWARGKMYPQFYSSYHEDFSDFIASRLGTMAESCYLEIFSPYFDGDAEIATIRDFIERLNPKEARILLPMNLDGEVTCSPEVFTALRGLNAVNWGEMPESMRIALEANRKLKRFAHAKVYRFFRQKPYTEFVFVGSVNLTTAGTTKGKNVESGFLIDTQPSTMPDFWLSPIRNTKRAFAEGEQTDSAQDLASPIAVRYDWNSRKLEVRWMHKQLSPEVKIQHLNSKVAALNGLTNTSWQECTDVLPETVEKHLQTTPFFRVLWNSHESFVLVHEVGMAFKPSIALTLTVEEILQFWALLTDEQKASFLESQLFDNSLLDPTADMFAVVQASRQQADNTSIFSTYAGIFYSFANLERVILEDLNSKGNSEFKIALWRLLGDQFDSLKTLVSAIESDSTRDATDTFVILQCADQLLGQIVTHHAKFVELYQQAFQELQTRVSAAIARTRNQLLEVNGAEFGKFIDWFTKWFRFEARSSAARGSKR